MTETVETAFAKLNLSLDIESRLPDGYHAMRMVMQSVEFGDCVRVSLTDDGKISACTNLKYLPCDDRNIAVKAACTFFAAAGITDAGARIDIEKRIPVCAGLGGGSSDAAAVLRSLNTLTGAGFDRGTLESLAAGIGSDVAFCVAGGTALATGKGELLSYLPPLPDCSIVICKPGFSISTPELFKLIDCRKIKVRPDTDGIIQSLESGDAQGVARRMYNVFEDVLPRRYGDIFTIKRQLFDFGASGTAMTGTGSAVFGIFTDQSKARAAQAALSGEYSFCVLTRPTHMLDV